MSRCLACHTEFSGEADCPVCGNPNYIVSDMKPELLDKLQVWADDHRRNKLNAIEIHIYGYEYEEKDGKLVQKCVHIVKICDATELSFDNITWLEQKFAPINVDEILNLVVILTKAGKQFKKQEIPFKAPSLEDLWHIGARLTEGLGVSFAIGNEKNHIMTKSVSLL